MTRIRTKLKKVDKSIYHRMRKREIFIEYNACWYCPPKRGCNYWRRKPDKNWKKYRKTQYK
jgi:hypothetical protein